MYDRMCSLIEEEIHKISEKGINNSNIEATYKLVDILKDLKQIEYWDIVEANMESGVGVAGGYGEESQRNYYMNRGRYASNRYADEEMDKDHYRSRL